MAPPVDNPFPIVTSAMSPYTVKLTDQLIYTDSSGGAITLNLPAIGAGKGQANIGWAVDIKDLGSAATNNVTLMPAGTNKIETASSLVIDDDNGFIRITAGSVASGDWKRRGYNLTGQPKTEVILSLKGAALDLKTTGAKDLCTIPLGKIFIPTAVIVKPTVFAGIAVVGVAVVQDEAGNVLMSSLTLTGLDAVPKIFVYRSSGASRAVIGGAGGTKIQLNVTVGYTATTANARTDVMGYFLN